MKCQRCTATHRLAKNYTLVSKLGDEASLNILIRSLGNTQGTPGISRRGAESGFFAFPTEHMNVTRTKITVQYPDLFFFEFRA